MMVASCADAATGTARSRMATMLTSEIRLTRCMNPPENEYEPNARPNNIASYGPDTPFVCRHRRRIADGVLAIASRPEPGVLLYAVPQSDARKLAAHAAGADVGRD